MVLVAQVLSVTIVTAAHRICEWERTLSNRSNNGVVDTNRRRVSSNTRDSPSSANTWAVQCEAAWKRTSRIIAGNFRTWNLSRLSKLERAIFFKQLTPFCEITIDERKTQYISKHFYVRDDGRSEGAIVERTIFCRWKIYERLPVKIIHNEIVSSERVETKFHF